MLVDGEPVQTDDVLEWAVWIESTMENDARHVARTGVGDLSVSTVFLGINHQHGIGGPPILYETMIFGANDEYCERYETRDQAERGHKEAVKIAERYVRERARQPSER
jgi:hypothetical protein